MEEISEKLEDTFKDVTDITEPGNVDKILMILEQMRIADDEYMELLVNKLNDEQITWDQPWYQRNYGLTRKPQQHHEDGLETCAAGPITLGEGELIEENWQNFVSEYEVPDKPICFARWKNRAKSRNPASSPEERVRTFVMAYVARGLKRNLYQVYRYFLINYGNPVKLAHYTLIEEKVMEICFYHRPHDACVILPAVLGREPRGIYKRLYQYHNGKPEKLKLKWTLELATKLVHLLMEYSECTFEELMNKDFHQSIWLKVAEQMGQRYEHIRQFWFGTLHVQLFAECDIKTKSLRKIIYKKLRHSSYRIWSDILWKNLALEFPDGFTARFLYRFARNGLRDDRDYLTSPLVTVLARLREDKRKKLQRRLKSIKFTKKGKLKYVKHDTPVKQLMKSYKK